MSIIKIKCWREDKTIPLPVYAHNDDACCDLYAKFIELDTDLDRIIVHTGLHVEIPKDYEIELRPRSGLAKTEWYIVNTPGTVDCGYRGEIKVVFKCRTNVYLFSAIKNVIDAIHLIPIKENINRTNVNRFLEYASKKINLVDMTFPYKEKERIAQILIRKRDVISWEEVDKLSYLSPSERGMKGYGSTGL